MQTSILQTLDDGLDWVRTALGQAAKDRHSPLRWPVLCTSDGRGRTVVLRSFEAGTLRCRLFTDARSAKITALSQDPQAELVFFTPARMVQIRARGPVRIIRTGPDWQAARDSLSDRALKDYTSPGPGSVQSGPDLQHDAVPADDSFTLLDLVPETLDLLDIGRTGQCRAIYHRDAQTWQGTWRVP